MAYISTADWLRYINRLAAINKKARDEMVAWIGKYGFADTAALVDFAYGLATKYGEGAGALAAGMYDATAQMQNAMVEPAVPAETASYGEVAKTVRGTSRTGNPELVGGAVGRLVKRTAARTTIQNAERDGAEWAWVPHGDTCPFCIMLASNGWQGQSAKARKGGHKEHIHANCDCEYAVRFDGQSGVRGYDPDKYLAMYENAEGGSWQEKLNAMRRAQYAENADRINEQKRAAYAKKREFISVIEEYRQKATPGVGSVIVQERRKYKNRELENMQLIHAEFGGNITMLKESNIPGKKNPDYEWTGKLWEEQEPTSKSKNAIDANIREGIHQIIDNPGGIILDVGENTMPIEEIEDLVLKRLRRSASFDCEIIIIRQGKIEEIYRYHKIKR